MQVLQTIQEIREPVRLEHDGDDVLGARLVLGHELARKRLTGARETGLEHLEARAGAQDRGAGARQHGALGGEPCLHRRLALGHERDLAVKAADELRRLPRFRR